MWLHITGLVCCLVEICALLYPIVDPNHYYKYTPPEEEVTFHLYHRSDIYKDDQLFIGDYDSIDGSRFNADIPSKFIIHGWTHGKDVPWVVEMREAMAYTGLWNIIVVDWAPLSHAIYVEARVHSPVVGKQVANFLKFLAKCKNLSTSSMHLIGHSMGAQISAYAANEIRRDLKQTIGRITGLDPAAPLYEWPHIESMDEILDKNDANFVDVIHTNGGHLGTIGPSGHVDYYPNGGENQPGCGFWICSHLRSCEFWTASIRNPSLFKAYSYTSWDEYLAGRADRLLAVPMGIAADPRIPQGVYFLETSGEEQDYLKTKTTLSNSFT